MQCAFCVFGRFLVREDNDRFSKNTFDAAPSDAARQPQVRLLHRILYSCTHYFMDGEVDMLAGVERLQKVRMSLIVVFSGSDVCLQSFWSRCIEEVMPCFCRTLICVCVCVWTVAVSENPSISQGTHPLISQFISCIVGLSSSICIKAHSSVWDPIVFLVNPLIFVGVASLALTMFEATIPFREPVFVASLCVFVACLGLPLHRAGKASLDGNPSLCAGAPPTFGNVATPCVSGPLQLLGGTVVRFGFYPLVKTIKSPFQQPFLFVGTDALYPEAIHTCGSPCLLIVAPACVPGPLLQLVDTFLLARRIFGNLHEHLAKGSTELDVQVQGRMRSHIHTVQGYIDSAKARRSSRGEEPSASQEGLREEQTEPSPSQEGLGEEEEPEVPAQLALADVCATPPLVHRVLFLCVAQRPQMRCSL